MKKKIKMSSACELKIPSDLKSRFNINKINRIRKKNVRLKDNS